MEQYLQIAGTGLRVCRIGLGTVNAGLSWDGSAARRIFDGYLAAGGNFIDCARVYSDWVGPEVGRAERVLGDWLRHRGHHEDVVILTKGGHPRMDTMQVSRLSPQEVAGDLEKSLRALGVDAIDIYCYHRDDRGRPVEELVETMQGFVRAGKIRYYACSNWTAPRMREADAYCKKMGYRGFILNEALYNYGSAKMNPHPDKTMVTADAGMLKYHSETPGNVLTPYMGLCSGFFHLLNEKGEDAVRQSPYYTPGNLALFQKIKALAAGHGTGISQVLLGYLLTRSPAMVPLISADNEGQLAEALDTFHVDFSGEEF